MSYDEDQHNGGTRLAERDGWYDREQERLAANRDEAARIEAAKLKLQEQRAQQQTPGSRTKKPQSNSRGRRFTGFIKGLRRKSPAIAIALFLAGGSSAIIVSLAPGTPLLMMADILDRDLNTQLSAVDKTTTQLWRNKIGTTTKGSCGVVKVACRYETVNMDKMEKTLRRINASSSDKLMMTFDENKGFTEKRGRIKTISLINADGTRIDANSAAEFTRLMKSEPAFRAKMYMVYSPRFSVYKGKEIMDFLKKNKLSYAAFEKKKTTKEMREELDKQASSKADVEVDKLKAVKDKDGNDTGEYEDSNGTRYTAEEAEAQNNLQKSLDASPSVADTVKNVSKGIAAVNVLDTACTIKTLDEAVRIAAKTTQQGDMIRKNFTDIDKPSSTIRAEMATPELVEAASTPLMEQEANTKVADESKLGETPNGQSLPQVDNPRAGKNAFDAELVRVSRDQDYGGVNNMSIRSKTLLVGGSMVSKLGNAAQLMEKILSTRTCKVVQNNYMRAGTFVLAVGLGLVTFGAGTAASVSASLALGAMAPLLIAKLASIAAGRITEGLTGTDLGNGYAIGADAKYNGMARSQGMITMSPDEMTTYQNGKRETLQAYDELDRLTAADAPFDYTNKFSFLGSLARTTMPIAASLRTIDTQHLGGALAALPSVATTAMSTVAMPLTHASSDYIVKKDRYTYCNDPDYAKLGPNVAINPTCVMVFGLPENAMEMDPVENAKWMAAHGEIIADSDSGDPADNDADWNYKKFLAQCVEQQPGASEDIEADPTNGAGCVSAANKEKNAHYAKFKLSLGINAGLDQDLPGLDGGSEQAYDGGAGGKVGLDGWAYPTDKSKTSVSSGFGMRDGTRHNGIDLAGPLDTPIHAARDGDVIAAGPAQGFGNWIVIRHTVNGQRVDTVYGHMQAHTLLVKVGDKVTAGQPIAGIGSEGQSTGPHLHFEVWPGGRSDMGGSGQPVDPKPYLDKASGGGS